MSYDVLVIGGGPAGLSASINVRARGRSALVVSNPLEENPLWRAEKVDNYLGLSDNQRLIKAAKEAMDTHGYGMSSVRFICGTQDLHKQLEAAISDYFKTEDTMRSSPTL